MFIIICIPSVEVYLCFYINMHDYSKNQIELFMCISNLMNDFKNVLVYYTWKSKLMIKINDMHCSKISQSCRNNISSISSMLNHDCGYCTS